MRLTESQFVRMTPTDKQLLVRMAEREERSPSDVVRRLIRNAARRLKIESAPESQDNVEVPSDRANT